MYYNQFDGLGDVDELSNKNNEIIKKYIYNIFGEVTI